MTPPCSAVLDFRCERVDLPFRNALGLGDRYLNASVSIVAPPGTNASSVQLSEVTLNGHTISAGLLDWQLPGVGKSLRNYVIKYASKFHGVTDGEIKDGKVMVHQRSLIVLTTRMCIRPNLSGERAYFSLAISGFERSM